MKGIKDTIIANDMRIVNMKNEEDNTLALIKSSMRRKTYKRMNHLRKSNKRSITLTTSVIE